MEEVGGDYLTSNYSFKPIAELALRSNQTIVPQRLNAALGLMSNTVRYVLVKPDSTLPKLNSPAFRAIVVVESAVNESFRNQVSTWLVDEGCLFMMAWGLECSSWDDSVDYATLEKFGYSDIPEDQSVLTTWHDGELLSEVCWFSKNSAMHPDVALERTIMVHISSCDREAELLSTYAEA